MTIPAALAHAQLAGLQAVYGLYASIVPALLYAVFGTSRQLQIGPGSTLSILVAASLSGRWSRRESAIRWSPRRSSP